jgi:hypothetical protein
MRTSSRFMIHERFSREMALTSQVVAEVVHEESKSPLGSRLAYEPRALAAGLEQWAKLTPASSRLRQILDACDFGRVDEASVDSRRHQSGTGGKCRECRTAALF